MESTQQAAKKAFGESRQQGVRVEQLLLEPGQPWGQQERFVWAVLIALVLLEPVRVELPALEPPALEQVKRFELEPPGPEPLALEQVELPALLEQQAEEEQQRMQQQGQEEIGFELKLWRC